MCSVSAFKRGETQFQLRQGVQWESVEIELARVRLRPIDLGDAGNVNLAFTPEVAQYMTPSPNASKEETSEFIAGAVEGRSARTDLQLVIDDKESADFLGLIGMHSRFGVQKPEIGVWLKQSAWGSGLGEEAVRGLLGWMNTNLTYDVVVYPVAQENRSSVRIAQRLGGQVVASEIVHRDWNSPLTIDVYEIPRSQGY